MSTCKAQESQSWPLWESVKVNKKEEGGCAEIGVLSLKRQKNVMHVIKTNITKEAL